MRFLSSVLALFPNEPSEMNMNTWTLAFEGQAESEYTKEKNGDYIGQKRIGLIAAILIYAIFFFLDMAVMPEYKYFIWFVRFVFIFVTLAVILLTYVERVRPYLNYLISFIIVAGGVGNLVMMQFAPAEVASSYNAGLILMFMLCYGVLRTSFIQSAITGLIILVSYELAAVFVMDIPKYVLLNNNFFYLAANILGMLSAYKADYNSRRGFYLTYKLKEAQKALRSRPRTYVPVEVPEEPVEEQETLTVTDAVEAVEEVNDYEKDLRDAGMTMRMLMERISDVVWYSDLDGNFIYVSPSCQRLWGYDEEQAKKMSFRELFTRESYDYYMAELESALASDEAEIRPLELEIICKNRVIKAGEVVSIAVKDHEVYGSGIIGVSRDISLRKSTEQELRRFNEELEELIGKRTIELENALSNLKHMEETLKSTEAEITELQATEPEVEVEAEPEIEVPEEVESPIVGEMRQVIEGNLKTIVKLKEMTKHIVKLYDIKTMKRFDLEKFFRDSTKVIHQVDHDLRDAAKKLSGPTIGDVESGKQEVPDSNDTATSDAFSVGDYIEKVFIGLGHRFMDTNHVVEIQCADEIEAVGHPEVYSQVIENLVSYSLDHGFKHTNEGEIVINVQKEDEILSISYRDNGEGLTNETIKQLFKEPYQVEIEEQADEEAVLYRARGVVQNELNGEFECNSTGDGMEFLIMIPDQTA